MKYSLDVRAHTHITRERDPEDEWSGESTQTERDFYGLVICKDDYHDVSSNCKLSVGDTAYVLIAQYSTGDSFSHHGNYQMSVIEVFKDKKNADALKSKVEEVESAYRDPIKSRKGKKSKKHKHPTGDVDYVDEAGKKHTYCIPWLGYFEGIESLEVHELKVLR